MMAMNAGQMKLGKFSQAVHIYLMATGKKKRKLEMLLMENG